MSKKPENKKTFVILGPTSSGKTSLALELCRRYRGEIISADSRQVYKYMDIGTGKAPVGEALSIKRGSKKWVVDNVNIWGYDLVYPGEYSSAYDFAQFALPKIEEIENTGTTAILVGGTGFYIETVTGKTKISAIKPDYELRKILEDQDIAELQQKLMSLNLKVFDTIDRNNKVRLIRAIERELVKNTDATPLPYPDPDSFVYIGLTSDRSVLYKKADMWLDAVWASGLLDEVHCLINLGFADTPQIRGLVYKSALAYINNEKTEQDAIQRAKYDLHSYVRRQQTWFKRIPEIIWFDISDKNFSQKVFDTVESYIRR